MRRIVLRCAVIAALAAVIPACAGNDRAVSHSGGASTSSAPALWPVAQQTRAISSAYGTKRGRNDIHRGVDIRAPAGTPVIAAGAGRVIVAGNGSGYGRYVVLDHDNGLRTLYAHLQDFSVKTGERVTRGQQIGRVGKSGNATGYHLHYEVHRGGQTVDPAAYLP